MWKSEVLLHKEFWNLASLGERTKSKLKKKSSDWVRWNVFLFWQNQNIQNPHPLFENNWLYYNTKWKTLEMSLWNEQSKQLIQIMSSWDVLVLSQLFSLSSSETKLWWNQVCFIKCFGFDGALYSRGTWSVELSLTSSNL